MTLKIALSPFNDLSCSSLESLYRSVKSMMDRSSHVQNFLKNIVMAKKILYSIAVFGIIGLGLYISSTFEYHEYYEECEKQSNTQGGIESCVDFMIEEAKK